MTRTETVRELMGEVLGVSGPKLEALLDLYVAAVKLDNDDTPSEPPKAAPVPPTEPAPVGKPGPKAGTGAGEAGREAAALKKTTHTRLIRYREKHGAGCYGTLVQISNGALTDDELRDMASAAKMPVAKWKLLAAVLDRAEGAKDDT